MKPRFLTKAEWKESLCSTCAKSCGVVYAVTTMCSEHIISVPDRYKQLSITDELAKLPKGER